MFSSVRVAPEHFSDGKLNTLVKDKFGRNHEVLRIFAEHGAPESITYESKPHIGTDVLSAVVKENAEIYLCSWWRSTVSLTSH